MTYIFATFIIPNGLKNQVITKCEAKDAQGNYLHPGLPGMFTAALVNTADADNAPAKAWASSGMMTEEEVAYCNAQLPGPFEYSTGEYDATIDGKPTKVKEDGHGFLARMGYRLKPGEL
jgi:hypothetical protein